MIQTNKQERGVVLLILLSILVLALSSVIIANLSLNKMKARNTEQDIKVMQRAQQALLAYALIQPVVGSLPCPDSDFPADGLENRSGIDCSQRVGWLPYRDLGLDDLQDSGASSLWYAVAPSYTASSGINRNPSITSHYRLDARDVAALVIAPGRALQNQQRNAFDVRDFLEQENANASVDTYAQNISDDNNDLLLGLYSSQYWYLKQIKILNEVAALLSAYKNACGEYPWAADFSIGADNSITNQQMGSVPLDTALPQDWGSGCAAGVVPGVELRDHWRDQLYFHFCLAAEGNCLQLTGDSTQQVAAIVLAPGVALATQNRINLNVNEFFEDENSSGTVNYKYLKQQNLDSSFNDVLVVVEP